MVRKGLAALIKDTEGSRSFVALCQQSFTTSLHGGDIGVLSAASKGYAQRIFRFQQNRVADASGRRRAEAGGIGSRKNLRRTSKNDFPEEAISHHSAHPGLRSGQ